MRVGRAAGVTDTGRRRLQNEDAFVCEPPLFAVADGMGGAQAGEIASRLAAAAFEERIDSIVGADGLIELVREANTRIFERALRDRSAAGMGTTTTLALLDEQGGTVTLAHVGDSRAYRLRAGRLEQLTADHSLVGELIRSGRLTAEEAVSHPHRSVITRALGTEADVEVDTRTMPVEPGDLYLLCSDGLPTMMRDEAILAEIDRAGGDPGDAADALVAAANAAGGEDNVTVVLFEVLEGDPEPRSARAMAARDGDEATMLDLDADTEADTDGDTEPLLVGDAVRRHGAARGSRWPALLFVLALALVAAVAVWWSLR